MGCGKGVGISFSSLSNVIYIQAACIRNRRQHIYICTRTHAVYSLHMHTEDAYSYYVTIVDKSTSTLILLYNLFILLSSFVGASVESHSSISYREQIIRHIYTQYMYIVLAVILYYNNEYILILYIGI